METLERISRGDERALEELLQGSWGDLVRYLLTFLSSTDQAKDAAQEAFVRLWAGRDRWRPGSARGLLFRLGRNAALDQLRKEEVRTRWAWEKSREEPDSQASPEQDLLATEAAERFQEAMAELPPRRREVFHLVRFRGLSYAEAATALEISYQTVANQMTMAHRDLRRLLGGFLGDGSGVRTSQPERRSGDG
jgi:RNA polymerase sigma-70 factor (ECF subfamily)